MERLIKEDKIRVIKNLFLFIFQKILKIEA